MAENTETGDESLMDPTDNESENFSDKITPSDESDPKNLYKFKPTSVRNVTHL